MSKVNKEQLLKELEAVTPGLSPKEIIEQSSCFVFQGGEVKTFNDEVACTIKSSLEITGAVQAKPLMEVLKKSLDDELEIEAEKGEFFIRGKRFKCKIRMEEEVNLNMEGLESPKKWKPLPEDFSDAVSMVQSCASRNEDRFEITCINICPTHMEACDGNQLARYELSVDLKKPFLCRKESLKHIVSMDMTEFSETKTWVHFKNPNGLVLSCRRFSDEAQGYPDLTKYLKVKGTTVQFPKDLKDAVSRAEIFSAEDSEKNIIEIKIGGGKLKITGRGAIGWLSENKGMKSYTGPELSFGIAPQLFVEITNRFNKFIVNKDRLKVKGEKFQYVTCLVSSSKE